MKRFLTVVVILAVLGLALPVSNLVIPLPGSELAGYQTDDTVAAKAVALLEKKCVHCHNENAKAPYYAALPVAGALIRRDIAVGTEYADYVAALQASNAVGQALLAKTEHAIQTGTMPPPPTWQCTGTTRSGQRTPKR